MVSNLPMRPFALAFLAAVALLAQPSSTVTDPDAYAVYNAVIPSDSMIRGAHPTELLIQDTTELRSHPQGCLPSGPGLTGVWQDALDDYLLQNDITKHVMQQFKLPLAYRLESKQTIQGFFTASGIDGWKTFFATYPKARGFLQVSAVGFDKTHTHALVYMAHTCGGLCGEGGYHFLERADFGWGEVRLDVKACMWAS